MSADIKWEAVDTIDLKAGDAVRLLHGNGDVVHAVASTGRGNPTLFLDMVAPLAGWTTNAWTGKGYRFERAVPERTLPTEDGWYQAKSATEMSVFELYNGVWFHVTLSRVQVEDLADLPDDLVRLVPVTEVEELRQRISTARAHLRTAQVDLELYVELLHLLNGEATNV